MTRWVSSVVLWALASSCSQDGSDRVTLEPRPNAASALATTATVGAARAVLRSPAGGAMAINPRLLRRFQPLEANPDESLDEVTRARVDLGRALFYETRLSRGGDLSCNSCHDLAAYGVDHRKTSIGHARQLGRRNAPSVYNAAGFFAQFWDGRAPDVETQAKGPILNPVEMAMTSPVEAVRSLKSDPSYRAAFRAAFPADTDPITLDNVGRAIGAFERGLLTPSRWDAYLAGDDSALSQVEKNGLKVFLDSGCMVCHTGRYLGGSMFERVGVVEPWPNQADRGRADVTHAAGDDMMFKVPTLRNVEKTAPYFHDGSAPTLEDAVKIMGRHQLGMEFSEGEVDSIVAWLKSLTGTLPSAYIAERSPARR